MHTLKSRTILFMLLMMVLTTAVLAVTFRLNAQKALTRTLDDSARNLLDTTRRHVETQYLSIDYNRKTILNRRKSELKSAIYMAYGVLNFNYNLYKSGAVDEKSARQRALLEIQHLRYDDGTGYFWLQDRDKSFPTLIVHPTMPEMVGAKLTGNRKDLFLRFIDAVKQNGEGYVEYDWPKPTGNGVTSQQPKVSYVKLFAPWDIIIGTGVYVDDIKIEAHKRLKTVVSELNNVMVKQKIGESGYFFIFDEKKHVLVHPNMTGDNLQNSPNAQTGLLLLERIMKAAHAKNKTLTYLWDKPGYEGQYIFQKKVWVTYYKPLGWYISVSLYQEDYERQLTAFTRNITWISGILLLVGVLVSILLSRTISQPLQQLTNAVGRTGTDGLPIAPVSPSGTIETRTLGNTINSMVDSIRTAGRQLQESEHRFRTIFEAAGESIILINGEQGNIVEYNALAHESLGYSAEEFKGMHVSSLLKSQNDGLLAKYLEHPQKHQTVHFESVHLAKDGTERIVLVTSRGISVGKDQYNLILIRDVTEKTRMEELVIQTEKMMSVGGLAAGLAHEINNPLAGIIQNAHLLANRLKNEIPANRTAMDRAGITFAQLDLFVKSRKIDHIIEAILESGQRAADIVKNMLGFVRKETGDNQDISLSDLMDKTLDLAANDFDIQRNFDFRKITVIKEYAADMPNVSCQPGKLQQVFLNILKNGADAMAEKIYSTDGPEFRLRIYYESPWAIVEIEDNGPGIGADQRKRIFEPFFTTKTIGKGTGLGMSVSYFIIHEHHRGQLEVETEPGVYSRFIIKLPLRNHKR